MFDTIKANAKNKINNKNKQRIFIVSASIATLIATGETTTTTTDTDLFTSGDVNGTPTDNADTITIGDDGGAVDLGAGDDTAAGGDGVDTILGGAGADTISGGAGIDNLVVIGITVEGDYTEADLKDVAGTGIDLSALLTLADINNHSTSDVEAGETIDGGEDGAILYVFGEVDFTDVTLNNITKIYLDSEITLSNATLQTLISEGLTDLLGDGTIKAESSQLDLDGVNVPENVTIKDSNGNIILPTFTGETTASVAENSTTVGTFAVTDASAVGDVTYTISGTDSDLFNINSTTGEVTFKSAPDYENADDDDANRIYDISITATDEHQKSISREVAITVTNVNEAVNFSQASISINPAENQTTVTTVTATDLDGDDLTYTISGDDSELFDINETTGEITFKTSPNYESPTDDNTDNVYNISITATDQGGKSATQNAVITVTNANDAPTFAASSIPISVSENQIDATTVTATDADGDNITYKLSSDGADDDLFTIEDTTGKITFKNQPDFEAPGSENNNNIYNIEVTATDENDATATQNVAISVTNANDAPTFAASSIPISVSENQSDVTTVTATDADGDNITYKLSGDGKDDDLFSIEGTTGKITFKNQPDFEAPGSENNNNIYNIKVIATDENNATAAQNVAITVTNTNDGPTFAASSIPTSVSENQIDVTTVTATDVDGDAITYKLSGDGEDDDLFSIEGTTGKITFKNQPNFEAPGSEDNNNIYNIKVTATDENNATATQDVVITVTNANDAPTFTASSIPISVSENQSDVTTVTATDTDGDNITYKLSGDGTDDDLFTIEGTTGKITFKTQPDFEAPGSEDNNNIYNIKVTATDENDATATQNVAITVTNANDAPTFAASSIPISVSENQIDVTTVTAVDIDGDAITYKLSGDGQDDDLFTIEDTTGKITFKNQPDYETPGDEDTDNIYNITITATDEVDNTSTQNVVITVTNENEAVSFAEDSISVNVAENQTSVTTVAATDIDGDDITYTLSGDVDDDLFDIDTVTGEITFNTPEDYEFPTHSNQQYSVTVEATDGEVRASQTVNITVTDVGAATDPAAPALSVPPIQQYGSESIVNTHTTNAQQNSSVASLANGGYVVVWESSGQDGSGFGIYGQRFDNLGDEDGDEFLINNVTTLEQTQAHVVGLDDGGFVVVWQSLIISSDDSPFELLGRIFDDEGDAPEDEFQINTADFYVFDIDVEKLATGDFLVTWTSDGQDGDDFGVVGRVYEADGSNPTDEFPINSYTINAQSDGQITALADGGFIVAWNSNEQDGSQLGSYYQKFDADYLPDGGEILINATTDGYQGEVAITALNNGGFVTVWIDDSAAGSTSNGYEIKGNVYDADGIITLPEFTVNQYFTNDQKSPNVTSLADGSFLVTWESDGQDGDDYGIYGRRFMPNGDAIADEFLINTTTIDSQAEHAITALNNGGIVVTWTSLDDDDNGIYSQIFTVNSYKFGAGESYDFNILNQLPDGQTGFTLGDVTISGIPDSASFTDSGNAEVGTLDGNTLTLTQDELTGLKITLDDSFDANTSLTLSVSSTNSAGVHTTTELTVALEFIHAPEFDNGDEAEVFNIEENTTTVDTVTAMDEDSPSVTYSITGEEDDALFSIDSISGEITFLVAEDYENPTNSNNEYNLTVTATDPDGLTGTKSVIVNIIDAEDAPQFVSDDAYTVYMPDSRTDVATLLATDEDDGSTITYSLTGGVDDGLFSIDISTGKIDFDSIPDFESPTDTGPDNIYNITVKATSDGLTDTRDVEIHITNYDAPILYLSNEMARSGSEISLSSLPEFHQLDAALTSLSDGNFVATWSLDSENDNTEIYGQKYTIDGIKIGDEFHINTHTENGQDKPTITALEDGAFIVVWASYNQIGATNSKQDIYGQMFDNTATPTGDEFLVNTVTNAVQDNPNVTALTTGGFIVVWNGRDTGGKGILGQKYDAAGNADGVEFLINNVEINGQEFPDVAALADGGFVVVWQSYVEATESNEIYGRKYDSSGAVDAVEFQVNTHTNSYQNQPSITTLADGNFVVVWQSNQQDGGDYGIYGQIYTAAGATEGAEFSINTTTEFSQENANVTALNDGSFVVTWQSLSQDGDSNGVYGQRFDATGNTIDQEFQINSTTDGSQHSPAITSTQNGGFVAAWGGYNADTTNSNIFGQMYETSPIFKLVVNTSTDFDIISLVQPDQDDVLGDVTISGIPSGMIFTNNAGDLVGNLVDDTLTLTQAQLTDLEISSTNNNWGITELTLSVSSLDSTTSAVNATTVSQISIAVGTTISATSGADVKFFEDIRNFRHLDGLDGRDKLEILFDDIGESTLETVGNDILITNASGKGFLLHSVELIDHANDDHEGIIVDIADLYDDMTTDMTQAEYNNWLIYSYEYDIA